VNFGDVKLFTDTLDVSEKIENFDVDELGGIIDVKLTVAAQAAGQVDVLAKTKCGGVNLYDTYATELAAPGAWKLVNASTGAAGTITSVAAQDGTQSFRISAVTGTYKLSLADISVLTAAGVEGYESNVITVTIE
jgi:hypothetical protein